MIKEDCLFCKIAKGEIHSATVYEDSHFTVILDVNPATKGHCLIIPKEHFDNIYDLDGETAGKLFALATCIARAMKDALKCDGLNLVQNNGEVAEVAVGTFAIPQQMDTNPPGSKMAPKTHTTICYAERGKPYAFLRRNAEVSTP